MATQSQRRLRTGPQPIKRDADGNIIFRKNKKSAGQKAKEDARKGKIDVNRYCQACGHPTQHWVEYFCPKCGTHHDHLYCSEREPKENLTREQIEAEYVDAGSKFAPSGIDPTAVIRQMAIQNAKDTWEDRRHAA